MRILAIDTSTIVATAAVLEDEKLICEFTQNNKWTHSQKLLALIDKMLISCDLSPKDMDAFACSKGPGSFTGLRIGAATIKGMGQALGKPVIGIPTLDALAYNIYNSKGIICPILDAQQNTVYASIYSWKDKALIKLEDYRAIALEKLIALLNEKREHISFLGDGAVLHRERLIREVKDCDIVPHAFLLPRASSVASLAMEYMRQGASDTYHSLKPIYIRKSQAEVEYEKRQNIELSSMTIEDVDGVCEVENLSFKTPWSKESFITELGNDMARYIVAKLDDRVIGYGGMWFVIDEAHVTNIAVHPDFRGRKIGDKLVASMIDNAKKENIEKMTLEVRPSNTEARNLYKKYDFKDCGIRKGYYSDSGEDGIIMWKDI